MKILNYDEDIKKRQESDEEINDINLLISVIVPVYNAEKYLKECLDSLIYQTYKNIEIICIDDGSSDHSLDILKLYQKKDNRVKVFTQKNSGPSVARNVALDHANGDYISFVDADDFVAENFLEEAYRYAKNENADLVQFEYEFYTDRLGAVPSGRTVTPEIIEIHSHEERARLLMAEKVTYGCWNKLYRHALLKEANVAYAEHVIYEEPLFVYPLLFYAKKIVITNDIFYYYRQNDAGTMRNDMKQEETLRMHATVQLAVWNFMKQTPFFAEYYEEIKLYFLHTYLYETLYFAKLRGFTVSFSFYQELEKTVTAEVTDYETSPYQKLIPMQMKLYHQIAKGVTEEWLERYMGEL